jgi:hypothetical protein
MEPDGHKGKTEEPGPHAPLAAAQPRLPMRSTSAGQGLPICKTIMQRLTVALPRPHDVVELSSHLPHLLGAAAEQSATCLPLCNSATATAANSSSSSGECGRSTAMPAADNPPWTGAHYRAWYDNVQACIVVTTALTATKRLPQQQVLDFFSCPDAGKQPQDCSRKPTCLEGHEATHVCMALSDLCLCCCKPPYYPVQAQLGWVW